MRLNVDFMLLPGKTILNERQMPEDPLEVYKIKKPHLFGPHKNYCLGHTEKGHVHISQTVKLSV
jgi:hypothetical protein